MSAQKIVYLSSEIYNKSKKTEFIAQFLKNINRMVYACDVSYKIKIGNNLKLPHQGLGVVIGPGVIIGDNVTICQNVTLGTKGNGEGYSVPSIGNNVMIGTGSVILGSLHIGSNVLIGANSVVLEDIPNNVVVAGVPAKIVKSLEPETLEEI